MKLSSLTKRDIELQFYKRFCPVLFRSNTTSSGIGKDFISKIRMKLEGKKAITVVLSGPSTKELHTDIYSYYLCTNNSYRLINDMDFLYFLYDPFFTYRYIKRNNYIKNAIVVFFYPHTKFERIKQWNTQIHNIISRITTESQSSNCEYLLSNVDNPTELDEIETFFYDKLNWDGEFYNSGIVLLMLGSYFSVLSQLPLHVYGLDMGVGGLVHADSKSSISHPKFLSDRNVIGVSEILNNIKKLLRSDFTNHSYFTPLTEVSGNEGDV